MLFHFFSCILYWMCISRGSKNNTKKRKEINIHKMKWKKNYSTTCCEMMMMVGRDFNAQHSICLKMILNWLFFCKQLRLTPYLSSNHIQISFIIKKLFSLFPLETWLSSFNIQIFLFSCYSLVLLHENSLERKKNLWTFFLIHRIWIAFCSTSKNDKMREDGRIQQIGTIDKNTKTSSIEILLKIPKLK